MDHLTFAIQRGPEVARGLLVNAISELIGRLRPEHWVRLAVCGNPVQLSLFAGWEIRDLAYAGANKLAKEGVDSVDRSGRVVPGPDLGFPEGTEVVIPPAIRHEIGADALAMMLKSGFLDDDYCMVTDYGTNAEMALKVGDRIFSGSAAAGPAIEGQQIAAGMLAGPGAVSDLVRKPAGWQVKVLDRQLEAQNGLLLNLRSGICRAAGITPVGITGTGVIALIYAGLQDECIEPPHLAGGEVRLTKRIVFTEHDLQEAGKALGALRAGQMTLMQAADVAPREVQTMYMAGASGTYVDPVKAQAVGIVPPDATRLVQVGNTSLELAKDLARDPDILSELNALRQQLLAEHIMFATSDVFRNLYVYELALWTEGMAPDRYRKLLEGYGLSGYLDDHVTPRVERQVMRDIRDLGEGLDIFDGCTALTASWSCKLCMRCVQFCPEKALSFADGKFSINTGRCLGSACGRCEEVCPDRVFKQSSFVSMNMK